MVNSQQGPGLDGKFILAVVIITAVWIGWQSHLKDKYPESYKPAAASAPVANPETAPMAADKKTRESVASDSLGQAENIKETVVPFSSEKISFEVSSRGMGIKNVRLHEYTSREGGPVMLAAGPENILFATTVNGQREPLNFSIKKTGDNEFTGTAQAEQMLLTKIVQIHPEKFSLHVRVRAENTAPNFTGLVTKSVEDIVEPTGGFFLMPQLDHQEFAVRSDGTFSREIVGTEQNISETYAQTHIASFGSQYFATAIVDKSAVIPEFKAIAVAAEKKSYSQLTHVVLARAPTFETEYLAFSGPKYFEILKSIDPEMTGLINFGFFAAIAKGVLWLMKVLHSILGNWGIAIIILTIIVRILVLPFNLFSYKQMKAMTQIQPQMKIIRERYKDDANTMNQEIMKLMKDSKANPLGGCLPMLLQIPIFFALYQVIGQSIELYKAPFVFWIQDLSLKDPFYVLPILMGVTMFIQQKITPTAMEPAQQKVMLFLPIIFSLLMIALPSGLTLYIFVSSVFGVVQQYYFMKTNDVKIPTAT